MRPNGDTQVAQFRSVFVDFHPVVSPGPNVCQDWFCYLPTACPGCLITKYISPPPDPLILGIPPASTLGIGYPPFIPGFHTRFYIRFYTRFSYQVLYQGRGPAGPARAHGPGRPGRAPGIKPGIKTWYETWYKTWYKILV